MTRTLSLASNSDLRLVVNDLDAFDEIANDPKCFAHELAKRARAKYVLDHQPTAPDGFRETKEDGYERWIPWKIIDGMWSGCCSQYDHAGKVGVAEGEP